jgi:autotransporter-associated beta strand protein
MKPKSILRLSTIAIAITSSASAQVVNIDNQTLHYGTLLTDNFNTPSYNWWEFNNSIAADQGGTLAALAYSTSNGNGYTAQHSNGGYMLLTSDGWGGYGGMASPNHNFATTANTTNKPLEIQFDMWSVAGDAPDWIGFGLNAGQGQLFYEGVYGFATTVGDGIHNYKLVISDAAGTGSGFNGITDGAKIEFYKDNVWQQTITETLGTSDGYITFRTIPSAWTGWNIGHVENLKITSGQLTNPLATSTELNLSNNGSLNFGDVTQTVAKLDGTAGTTVKLLNSSLTVNGSDNSSFAGVISGSGGSLIKGGSGTLTLSGANTYSGPTTVTSGVLSLGNGTNSTNLNDTAAVTVGQVPASGAKIDLNFTGLEIVGSLTLDGTAAGGGFFDATSHPTYFTGTGQLFVAGGVIADNNGTWASSANGYWENAANWSSNTIASGIDKTATFNGALGTTVTLLTNITIGNLDFSVEDYSIAGAALTLDASATIPFVSVDSGRTATISANLAGIAGLEKTGAGTLVLTGSKSYTGGTTVTNGTLEIQGATGGNAQIHGSLTVGTAATVLFTGGDGTGFGYFNNPVTSITVDGGTIDAVNGSHLGFGPFMSMTLDNGGTIQGSWQWNGDSLLSFNSYGDSTNTISGNVVLRPDAGANHTFNVDNGAAATDLQINANLSDQWPEVNWVTASGLTKSGTGTMVLNGTNTYDGNTVVNDGTLEVTAAGSLHFRPTTNGATNKVSGSGTGALSFLGTVDLDLGIANTTDGNVWNLFNLASFATAPDLSGTAGVTSTLGAFTEVTPGTWKLPVTGAEWVFTEADGNLAYNVTATDYDNWVTANGVTGGENNDDDNDGLTNHEEYAFGTDPTGGSSVNPIAVALDKSTGTFSYTRRQQSLTGLSYTVWYSTDLATWAPDNGAVQGTPTLSGEVETVPVTISSGLLGNTKLFIQVRAN